MEQINWLDPETSQLETNFEKVKEKLNAYGFLTVETPNDVLNLQKLVFEQLNLSSTDTKYFISEKHKIAYCLSKYTSAVFNKELGLTRRHFVDKKLAKAWMSEMQKMFHPDSNINSQINIDFNAVSKGINDAYREMIGKK